MPQQYDNEMRFALFKNDKEGNDKRPDYRGTLQVAGVEYDLSAWIKEGRKGKFMSGQVQPKRDRQRPAPADEPAQSAPEENDDVPF